MLDRPDPPAPVPVGAALFAHAVADTERAARCLARVARAGDVVALFGELGAGKTTFARAFVRALTAPDVEVPSPTFTLVQTYDGGPAPVFHFDLYRLDAAEQAWELDIEDAFDEGISLIEWPERLGPLLPERALAVHIASDRLEPEARRIALVSGDWGARLEAAVADWRAGEIAGFLQRRGWPGADRSVLAADASFRTYDRVRDGGRGAVLMDAPPPQEDVVPFLRVAAILRSYGLSAPAVYASDARNGLVLLEDLGDATFTRRLADGADERPLYAVAVDALAAVHRGWARAPAAGVPPYDDDRLLTEAALLVDWFLPEVAGAPTAPELRDDYLALWRTLFPVARAVPDSLVLRDYHVDNLIDLPDRAGPGRCGLLDFQDAVVGPVSYDLVSLLEDARRDVPEDLQDDMTRRYLEAVHGILDIDRARFQASCKVLAAQRNAKIIGIFTRLWRRDGKPQYLEHIPRVWRLLEADLAHPALAPMHAWFERHVPRPLRRGLRPA